MAWLRIEDSFATHPKIVGLSDKAFRLHVTALCYCAKHLTDGFIPSAAVPQIASISGVSRPYRVLIALMDAGLWERYGGDRSGFAVHDWAEWNPTAEQVKSQRSAAKERMRRLRSGRKTEPRSREHPEAFGRSSANGSRERSPTPPHTPPPTGDGVGEAASPASEDRAAPPHPNHQVMTPEEVAAAYRRGFAE